MIPMIYLSSLDTQEDRSKFEEIYQKYQLLVYGDPKDITNVKFITSSTYQQKSYDTITDGQQVQFDL